MSDDPVSSAEQVKPSGDITVGDIVNSVGVAIGPNASVTIVSGPPPLSPEESARLLAEYRARVLEETRYVNLRGIPLPRGRDGRPMPLQVPLDKVYIRLQATTEKQQRVQEEAEERSLSDKLSNEDAASSKRDTPQTGIRGLFGRLRGESRSQPTPRDVLSTLHTLGEYFYRRGEVYEAEKRPEPVDPQDALKKHKRMVVLGAPGAGKSTLLCYLARRTAEDSSGFVPIQVSLRDYATALAGDSTLALSEFALRVASPGNPALRHALEDEIKSGRVLWLVDALDEARGWAADAARQAGQLLGQLILTSRPVGYTGIGIESLPHFEVLPLTPENVDEFLHSWFDLLAAQRAADDEWTTARVGWLKQQLEARPRIRTLIRNPLLLTFLVILAGEDPLQELPDQRAELYRRYVEELLDSWEVERRPKSGIEGRVTFTLGPLQDEQARQAALQGFYYLGWALHVAYYGGKPKEPPTRNSLTKTLADYLQPDWGNDARALSEAVLDFWQEAGLLETWHLEGDEYLSFRHLTFQEYAAAWGIAAAWKRDSKRAWKFLCPRLHHYAWHEPILLLVGLMNQVYVNDFANHLLRGTSPYERSLHRDLFLAGELLGEGALLNEGPHIIRRVDWLRRDHLKKRDATIFLTYLFGTLILSRIGFQWYLILLFLILFTLFFWSSSFFMPLAWRCFSYPTRIWEFVPDRTGVLRCLISIGSPSIPGLLRDLMNMDGEVRNAAAKALGQIGGAQAVSSLLQALQNEEANIRYAAAEALGQIGDAQAMSGLLQALQDEEVAVRYAAATALGQIGDVQAISDLIQVLHNSEPMVRESAAKALGQIGGAQIAPDLVQALHDAGWFTILAIVQTLARIGPSVVPILIEALHDSDSKMRERIANTLGQLGNPLVVPDLILALHDSDSGVRCSVAEALGRIGDAQAVPGLVQILENEKWIERLSAAKALGQIGDAQAVPDLILALHDSDSSVRRTVAEALNQLGDIQHAIPALIQILQDSGEIPEEGRPNLAAYTLARIGPPAVPALIQALQYRRIMGRPSAAYALGEIGDAQAVPALIQALHDNSDWNLPGNAATALAKCANNTDDIRVSKCAARSLWWLLTDLYMAADAFRALEQVANRLSVLEVEAMPLVDPLLPKRTKKR